MSHRAAREIARSTGGKVQLEGKVEKKRRWKVFSCDMAVSQDGTTENLENVTSLRIIFKLRGTVIGEKVIQMKDERCTSRHLSCLCFCEAPGEGVI